MERRSFLQKYVKATLLRLRVEKTIYTVQTGLFLAAFCAVLFLLVTRLFVLPYYSRFTVLVAGIIVVGTLIYSGYNRVKKEEAVRKLDSYGPHNLLMTALSIRKSDSPLAPVIIQDAESEVSKAYLHFKKRKKAYLHTKMMSAFIVCCAFIVVLVSFPSEAQLEADTMEKEQEIMEEMKKEVQQLMRKEKLPDVKKELVDLLDELEVAETSDAALKELVKKQKELRLKEQRLADKKEGADQSGEPSDTLTEAEEQELTELREVASELAQNAGKTNTALNKIGKAPTLAALADGISNLSNENGEEKPTTGEGSEKEQEKSDSDKNDANSDGNDGKQGAGQGAGTGEGEGEGEGVGQGEGTGIGSGGTGHGDGADQGKGSGSGSGGRDLLTIPNDRVGKDGDPSFDGGALNEGDFSEEREVDALAEKGTARPYTEGIGTYKQSYLESAGKMKLSPDLQRVLSNYFTSIE